MQLTGSPKSFPPLMETIRSVGRPIGLPDDFIDNNCTPSKTTSCRHKFSVDVANMKLHADFFEELVRSGQDFVIFACADSFPRMNKEWTLSGLRVLGEQQLKKFVHAMDILSDMNKGFREECQEERGREGADAALEENMRHVIDFLVPMGVGNANVASNFAAFLWSLALHSNNRMVLSVAMSRVFALTIDMAVEIHLNKIKGVIAEHLWPWWRRGGGFVDEGGVEHLSVLEHPPLEFSEMMRVPGLEHCVHNVCKFVLACFKYYRDVWRAQLQVVVKFLNSGLYRGRLIARCLSETHLEGLRALFEKGIRICEDHRSMGVCETVAEMLPLRHVHMAKYDENLLFSSQTSIGEYAIDKELVSSALKSAMF